MAWIIFILFSAYLVSSNIAFQRISNDPYLSSNQKRWNYFFVLLIPFFWALVVRIKTRPPISGSHTPAIKQKRQAIRDSFYESWKGFYG